MEEVVGMHPHRSWLTASFCLLLASDWLPVSLSSVVHTFTVQLRLAQDEGSMAKQDLASLGQVTMSSAPHLSTPGHS